MSSVVKSKLVRATAITVSIALFHHAGSVLVATCAIALLRVSVAVSVAVVIVLPFHLLSLCP